MALGEVTLLALIATCMLLASRGARWARAPLATGIALRVLLGLYNASSSGPIPGLDKDAVGFHQRASEIAAGLRDPNVGDSRGGDYVNHLANLYQSLGTSLRLGQLLSVLIWLLSAVVVLRLLSLCGLSAKHSRIGLWLFVLSPASLIWTSGTLREAHQSLVIALVAWAVFSRGRERLVAVPLTLTAVHLFWDYHAAIPVILVGLALGLLAVLTVSGGQLNARRLAFRLLSLGVAAAVSISLAWPFIRQAGAEDGAERILRSSTSVADTRAFYGGRVDLSSPVAAMTSLPGATARYLALPFPWQVRSALDVVAALDAMIRVSTLAAATFALIRWRRMTDVRALLFFTVGWIVVSATWAMGTFNFGTSMRHNVTSLPLMVIVVSLLLHGNFVKGAHIPSDPHAEEPALTKSVLPASRTRPLRRPALAASPAHRLRSACDFGPVV